MTAVRTCTHLAVDGRDDGGAHVHADEEAAVEVLVQDHRLDEGDDEERAGEEPARPRLRVVVARVVDQRATRQVKHTHTYYYWLHIATRIHGSFLL